MSPLKSYKFAYYIKCQLPFLAFHPVIFSAGIGNLIVGPPLPLALSLEENDVI